MRELALVAVASLLAGACSSGAPADPSTTRPNSSASAPEGSALPDGGSEVEGSSKKEKTSGKSKEGVASGSGSESGMTAASPKAGGGPRTASTARTSIPPTGTYPFGQAGWEEFCQAGNCDRSDLPNRMSVRLSHGSSGRFTATTRSGSTEQTISYALVDEALVIERIATQTTYQGFTTEVTIDPSPGIVALRFPIREGRTWSGTWEGGNGPDGSYSAAIVERTKTSLRGKSESAFILKLDLFFKGEIDGFTKIEAVAAMKDLMILATDGRTEASSQFGTYRSEFSSEYHG